VQIAESSLDHHKVRIAESSLDLHKVRIAESALDLHKVQSDKNHLQKRSDLQADGNVCLIPVLQQTEQTEYTLRMAETELCSDIEEV
jgi:hypothetical protein